MSHLSAPSVAAVARRLPPNTPMHQVHCDFADYPGSGTVSWLWDQADVYVASAVLYHCTPRWQVPEKRVPDDILFSVISGHGDAWLAGRHVALEPGRCVHFPRNVPLRCRTDPRDPVQVQVIHYTARVHGAMLLAEVCGFPDAFRLPAGSPVPGLLQEACREYALRPAGWQAGLNALLLRALMHLVRESPASERALMPESTLRLEGIERILPALQAMAEDMAHPKPLPKLAERCALSDAQFRRVFRRATGVSPVQYLVRLRMERACRLLRTTALSVEAISAQVGYAQLSCFSTVFRKVIGLSPGQYRLSGGI